MGNKLEHELNLIDDIESYPANEKRPTINYQLGKIVKQSESQVNGELNESETRKGKLFFVKKKRKNKFDKSEQNLTRPNQLVKNQSEFSLSSKNAQVQCGNGLISLKNLHSYLESDDRFHLVNRIIKRIGVFNRQTQTDFDYHFDDECMKIVEVSARLVDQLENLNSGKQSTDEQDEPQHYAGFNMIYTSKSNLKTNSRNVCIQKCINKATVGTQTIQSRSHLIIIEILNRLNKLNKLNRLSDESCLETKKNLKRSDTFNLNSSSNIQALNHLSDYSRRRVHSQPALKDLNMNELNMDDRKDDELSSIDCLESMDKDKLEEYLKNLLIQVQVAQENQKKDDLPEYAARCPSLRKKELIYSANIFDEVDKKALEAPDFDQLNDLVDYLTKDCENDLFKVRAIFRWITNNLSFDWKYIEEQHKRMTNTIEKVRSMQNPDDQADKTELNNNIIEEEDEDQYMKDDYLQSVYSNNDSAFNQNRIGLIYRTRLGGSKEFVELFIEMCIRCDIRCKLIQGFAKSFYYRPGHMFLEEDINNLVNRHHWLACYVLGDWHLIDITWSTGYCDPVGRFQKTLNEFYFFVDPEQLVWSHFPFNQSERDYHRWQLLDQPITLDNFNNLPKITAAFFDFNLKLRSKISNPVSFKVQTEIKISAHEPLRFKYKLFHIDELENGSLNNFVFCSLKQERLVASFVICPPLVGRYYFKIYAKSEKELQDQNPANASLHYISTILLECTKARKYQNPYPLNELPYGPVQAFYNYQMQLINQNSAIITTFGGKRKLNLKCNEPMLLTYQIQDADGQEQDTRTMISRDDENSTNMITLNILPPRVGMFKLSIFGMPRLKPNQRGKQRLPLLATFLIDCRLAKINSKKDNDPPPLTADLFDSLGKKSD